MSQLYPVEFLNVLRTSSGFSRRKTSESLRMPDPPKWNAVIEQFVVVHRGLPVEAVIECANYPLMSLKASKQFCF
jgi:hypothetical protein